MQGIGFENAPLEQTAAVGICEVDRVRLWARTKAPGAVRVRWWRRGETADQGWEAEFEVTATNDHTASVLVPPSGQPPLAPATAYRFDMHRVDDGSVVGDGRFETTPERDAVVEAPVAFAVMSCNQPFAPEGAVLPASRQMLAAAHRAFDAHDVRGVLMVGDQMYSDYPADRSLFDADYFRRIAPEGRDRVQDCTTEEVRRLFHARYRHFWGMPEMQRLYADFPCYPILDDHEIIDNWGSRAAHQEPEWASLGEGARLAYFDYQATRTMASEEPCPEDFDYTFEYGPVAGYVLDLRSQRTAGGGGRLFSADQWRRLVAFFEDNTDRQVLMLVLSVPVVHLPKALAEIASRTTPAGEDFSDRWSSLAHVRDRDRVLRLLHDHQRRHPEQRIVLVSGDIHIGCVHRVSWHDGTPPLFQIISSPITHDTGWFIRNASMALIRMNREVEVIDESLAARVRLLEGERERRRNPAGGLNAGIVEVRPGAPPRLRFHLYGHHAGEPVCRYRSPWV